MGAEKYIMPHGININLLNIYFKKKVLISKSFTFLVWNVCKVFYCKFTRETSEKQNKNILNKKFRN